MRHVGIGIVAIFLAGSFGSARADYTLLLKNGRTITVPSYRESGGMIRFPALGGEVAIAKDQVQAIRKNGDSGLRVSEMAPEAAPRPVPEPATRPVPSPEAKAPGAEPPAVEEAEAEEKQYQAKIRELTRELKELREKYASATRGNTGSDPAFFTSEEAFRGHQEDLLSRLRDAQYKAQGLPTGPDAQSPPFSLAPLPPYSAKQKELSELRNRISQVENERTRLIEEMKAKNINTGSLFLDE